MAGGRPSTYSPEITAVICARIASGESLRTICVSDEMPAPSTVFLWLSKHPEFSDQYARAREAQMDAMAEEILEIADDGERDTYKDDNGNERTNQDVVQRSRLRVDTRKWLMSKMAPKKYGERMVTELTGANGGPIDIASLTPVEREQRIAAVKAHLLAQLTKGVPNADAADHSLAGPDAEVKR